MSKIKSKGPFSSFEIESKDISWTVGECLNCKAKNTEIAALKAELAEKDKEIEAMSDPFIEKMADVMRPLNDVIADLEFDPEQCEKQQAEIERLKAELEHLKADLKFLGASHKENGDLEINMRRYHKAHCENCDLGEDCMNKLLREEIERLRDGLRRLEWHEITENGFFCPACGNYDPRRVLLSVDKEFVNHKSDCWLKALLEGK